MNNAQMVAGRFRKLYVGKKKFSDMQAHLAKGGIVVISTYTKATKLTLKHAAMLHLGRDGSLYLQRGKNNWDCIDYSTIRLY